MLTVWFLPPPSLRGHAPDLDINFFHAMNSARLCHTCAGEGIPVVPDIEVLIEHAAAGDAAAYIELKNGIHAELRGLARAAMSRERRDHTLQPTALVNEAWLRLVARPVNWESRAEFLRASAHLMREILVDHARARCALKRGEGRGAVPLHDPASLANLDPETMLALDAAMTRLATIDSRSRQVVELRYFAGLTTEETASVMNVSVKTIRRDWDFARAWLEKELRG